MTRRVAAIDCGTNSVRLLIADVAGSGLVDVVREMRVVRLGQDVDRTRRLAPEAIERTRMALHDYASTIAEREVAAVRMVATSASRDAVNRNDFVAMVLAELGVEPEVITGDEEAELSFLGAASALPSTGGALLVVDIGGGSTELVRSGDGELHAYSMDVGCVRMTERHLRDDPPTQLQIDAVIADLGAAISTAREHVPLGVDVPFVGVAGTVTTVAALALGLPAYDPEAIHGASLTIDQVREVTDRVLHMPRVERAALPVMHPGRVDVIGAGALILQTLMEAIGARTVIAGEHDILDGIALRLAASG